MSTLKTTNIQHPSAGSPNLVLAADGSVSGGAGLGGLVHIHTEDFTARSSVSIDDVFDATYDNYLIVVAGVVGSVATGFRLRWRASSSDATGSNYKWANRYFAFSGSVGTDAGNPTDHTLVVGATGTGAQRSGAHIFVNNPYTSSYTNHQIISNSNNSSAAGAGMHEQATAYDGFTVYPVSGTITGTIRVYGYAND